MMLQPMRFVNVENSEAAAPFPDYGLRPNSTLPPLSFKLSIEPHNHKVDISASVALTQEEVLPMLDIQERMEAMFLYEQIVKHTGIRMGMFLEEILRHAFPRYIGIETVWLIPRRMYPGEYEEVVIHSTLPRDPNVDKSSEDTDTDDLEDQDW